MEIPFKIEKINQTVFYECANKKQTKFYGKSAIFLQFIV